QECYRLLTWIGIPVILLSFIGFVWTRNRSIIDLLPAILTYGIGVTLGIFEFYLREELAMVQDGRSAVLWLENITLWLCTACLILMIVLILKQTSFPISKPLSLILISIPFLVCTIIWLFFDISQIIDFYMSYFVLFILIHIAYIINLTFFNEVTTYEWISLPLWITLLFVPFYQFPGWWFHFEPISLLSELIWMRHTVLLLLVVIPILFCFTMITKNERSSKPT
ncbi:MAG: hypothetical protein ACFFCQ_16785, partial [Promethearchaeota archaeon]